MPASRTHAILNLEAIKETKTYVEIDKEYMKVYSFGPDTLIATDYKTFIYQHSHKVKRFFEVACKQIKQRKLLDNPRVMTWLYSYLGHYMVDCVFHPFIISETEGLATPNFVDEHAKREMKYDDYVCYKYGIDDKVFFHRLSLGDAELEKLISCVYRRVFHVLKASSKYNWGILLSVLFDTLCRNSSIVINPLTLSLFNIGDITRSNIEDIRPYLNLDHNVWRDPITGEEHTESFDDLWEKSIMLLLEAIEDVNKYLYFDLPLKNRYISANASYNTGYPCAKEERFVYAKQYILNHLKKDRTN